MSKRVSHMQAFSDTNTKMVSGYGSSGGSEGASGKVEIEKVSQVTGSCAGANSGEFDVYRAARNRENARMASLEDSLRKEAEAEVFSSKVARNKREADERTEKNRAKRLKKKMKSGKKASTDKSIDSGSESDGGEDDKDKDKCDALSTTVKPVVKPAATATATATTASRSSNLGILSFDDDF